MADNTTKKPPLKIKMHKWQITTLILMIYDICAVNLSYLLALWLRFDCAYSKMDHVYSSNWLRFVPVYSLIVIAVFVFLRLYRSIWQFASYTELLKVIIATAITAICHSFGITVFFGKMPVAYHLVGPVIQFVLIIGIRFSYRFVTLLRNNLEERLPSKEKTNVMIIGAGSAGQMIVREINNSSELTEKVACIIDDDPSKWRRFIDGVPIEGGTDDIMSAVEKYNIKKIYFAIPSATPDEKRNILNICSETDCELMSLPGMYQFMLGQVSISNMKEVSVEDLLGREPFVASNEEVFRFISDKVVLVTGGGGSIGSELCRQIAAHSPKQLIIFDVYENNAYSIQLELREKYPDLDLVTLIGSVRDSRKLFQMFAIYHPDIVYHAAAHKHVPLMEDSPCEAIKNNAIGTYKTAYAAMIHGCSRFVLISTDKAVNPTNIMGASKRLCEMIIQSFDEKIKQGKADEIPQLFTHSQDHPPVKFNPADIHTEFVAVRFGNVLGSNGSVIPIFKKQIEHGGPVTVTHPDIIRYFMTIPEAVSLVMLAGTFAHGGEIFVLDMGSPVKIDTLARNLIKLSGFKPDVDIKIEYTGLRPGEKLYEEKLMAEEGLKKTSNKMIHIGQPIPFEVDEFFVNLYKLMYVAYSNKPTIRELVATIVTTYHPENVAKKDETFYDQLESINSDYAEDE